jgi:RHS repeat-associated protein
MFSDHLGSTSITTDADGNVISELRYKPWGEVRYAGGNTPTEYQFTSQYSYETDFGLLFFNARWLDPSTGRFAQADTIIPHGQGVQAWDRYAFVNNNPLRYTDPSGHALDDGCRDYGCSSTTPIVYDHDPSSGSSGGDEEDGNDDDIHNSNDDGCPDDVGFVLFCSDFSTDRARDYWEDSGTFANWIDILGIGGESIGFGLSTLGFLTKLSVLSPEVIALLFGASISPDAVTKIGLVALGAGLYASVSSYEIGNINDNIVRSGMYDNGGKITVSMFGSKSSEAKGLLVVTVDSSNGRYQTGNLSIVPMVYIFGWASLNPPPGSSWQP